MTAPGYPQYNSGTASYVVENREGLKAVRYDDECTFACLHRHACNWAAVQNAARVSGCAAAGDVERQADSG